MINIIQLIFLTIISKLLLKMGGMCEAIGTEQNGIEEDGQIPLQKISSEEVQAYLEKIERFQGSVLGLELNPNLKALMSEFNEQITAKDDKIVWTMQGHGLPLYLWVANQKPNQQKLNQDKKSLLNNEVKALFTEFINKEDWQKVHQKKEQLLLGMESGKKGEEEKQKEIVAYFHGKTKDGFAYTLKGIYLHGEGRIYKGGMANSKANSHGVFENRKTGYRYQGFWQEDLPHEKGKQKYSSYLYNGQFLLGKKSGKGALVGPGFKYEGMFQKNQFQGKGVLETDKELYEGQFYDGKKYGEGIWIHKVKNQRYDGQFEDDMKSGYGVFHFQNGYRYQGEFKNDMMDGEGKIFKDDKLIHMGVWANNNNLL